MEVVQRHRQCTVGLSEQNILVKNVDFNPVTMHYEQQTLDGSIKISGGGEKTADKIHQTTDIYILYIATYFNQMLHAKSQYRIRTWHQLILRNLTSASNQKWRHGINASLKKISNVSGFSISCLHSHLYTCHQKGLHVYPYCKYFSNGCLT